MSDHSSESDNASTKTLHYAIPSSSHTLHTDTKSVENDSEKCVKGNRENVKDSKSVNLQDSVSNPIRQNDDQPVQRPMSRARAIALMIVATATMSLNAMGSTSLNIALPTIQKDFNIPEPSLQWVMSAVTLTSACFMLLSGSLADVYGRKLCSLVGIAWFGGFSIGGGFSQNGPMLIILRAFCGIGTAIAIPSMIGIIAANFDGQRRATTFALFAAGAPLGGGIGTVLGGLLTTYFRSSWRSAMWILGALAAATFGLALFVVPTDTKPVASRKIDWFGASLVTTGLVGLQIAISQSSVAPKGWATNYIIIAMVLAIACLTGFMAWVWVLTRRSNTTRQPLLRPSLLNRAKGRLGAVYLVAFLAWMGFQSAGYHASLLFQQVMVTGVMGAVVRSLPAPICGLCCNILVARVVSRVPTAYLICTGLLATGTASMLFAQSVPSTVYWTFPFNGMWLNVVGADFVVATSTIFVSAMAAPEEQSVAGAFFQTVLQFGGAVGLALTASMANSQQEGAIAIGEGDIEAINKGLSAAFYLGGAFALMAFLVALLTLRGLGIVGKGTVNEHSKQGAGGSGSAPTDSELSPVAAETGVSPGNITSKR